LSATVRDLHTHSNCSDGVFSPSELVRHVAAYGVEELSLTDHDTVVGLDEAKAEAERSGIRFLPGIELTCSFAGFAVHLLGYRFAPSAPLVDSVLGAYLSQVKERDWERARQMCALTLENPLIVTTSDGKEHRVSILREELSWVRGTIPRPIQMAYVLSQKLRAISEQLDIPARHCMYLFTGRPEPERRDESYWPECREKYKEHLKPFGIEPGTKWWVPTKQEGLDVREAIGAIHRIGGLPVLAHPGEQCVSAEHIRSLATLGLRGIEVYTFKHSMDLIRELEELAVELRLFTTAGTDFHDPYHRSQIEPGKDRSGNRLRSGVSLDQLAGLR
jgi:3',5'-nucleoside bisphosphate phosphatase